MKILIYIFISTLFISCKKNDSSQNEEAAANLKYSDYTGDVKVDIPSSAITIAFKDHVTRNNLSLDGAWRIRLQKGNDIKGDLVAMREETLTFSRSCHADTDPRKQFSDTISVLNFSFYTYIYYASECMANNKVEKSMFFIDRALEIINSIKMIPDFNSMHWVDVVAGDIMCEILGRMVEQDHRFATLLLKSNKYLAFSQLKLSIKFKTYLEAKIIYLRHCYEAFKEGGMLYEDDIHRDFLNALSSSETPFVNIEYKTLIQEMSIDHVLKCSKSSNEFINGVAMNYADFLLTQCKIHLLNVHVAYTDFHNKKSKYPSLHDANKMGLLDDCEGVKIHYVYKKNEPPVVYYNFEEDKYGQLFTILFETLKFKKFADRWLKLYENLVFRWQI